MKHYLIGYITETQTTKEAAELIALHIEKNSSEELSIDIFSIDEIDELKVYDQILLGSPIHGMRVIPAFNEFLIHYKEELDGRFAGLFIVSYLYPNCRNFWKKFIQFGLRRLKKSYSPSALAIFGGKIPKPMPAFVRFLFGTPDGAPLDSRDATEIENWVRDSLGSH